MASSIPQAKVTTTAIATSVNMFPPPNDDHDDDDCGDEAGNLSLALSGPSY